MEFRVLGPLQLAADGGYPIPVNQPLIRATISVLVAQAGRLLSREELMELIWPNVPSSGALRTCLYDTRRVLGGERLVRHGSDYRLVLRASDRTDLIAFRQSAASGEHVLSTGQSRTAAALFADALAMWHDPPLEDFPNTSAAREIGAGLLQERRRTRDLLVETKLQLGDHHGLVSMLEAKAADEPLNEAGWAQLMLALYRSGRPSDALQAYDRASTALAGNADARPGPELRQLRQMVEVGDPALGAVGRTFGADRAVGMAPLPGLRRVPREAPTNIGLTKANVARMWDFFLGGKDNFAVDREAVNKILEVAPQAPALARENRAFLGRAVRLLAHSGIRQFIDVGSGLPTRDNVHEVAQIVAPDARVAYVDNDPVVLSHSRALLTTTGNRTVVIQADMRRSDDILDHPDLKDVIDLYKPVAVLFTSVLNLLTDDERPAEVVARFRERMAPGSHVVISHVSAQTHVEAARRGNAVYARVASARHTLRDREQILRLFDGFELIPPGLVPTREWRPDRSAARPESSAEPLPVWFLGGVGQKR